MRGAPLEETIMPFIARGFSEANTEILQKIRQAWNKVEREDKELRGRSNSVIGGYHKWLKSRVQGIVWLKKDRGLEWGRDRGVRGKRRGASLEG